MTTPNLPENSVLKTAREKCHKARDDFYKCVEETGEPFNPETGEIPRGCRRQRKAFEQACRASWVKHFDIAHDKNLKLLQTLRGNINKGSATAAGGLSGKDHRQ